MRHLGFALIVAAVAAGCGGSSSAVPSPVPPSTVNNLTGTWSGTSTDSTGQEKMGWTVVQTGNTLSGTMSVSDTGRNMMGSGSMQGTVNGATASFHMSVPNGGFSGMMSTCSMVLDGQATMSEDGRTMTGSYGGTMSGMMSSGGMMNQSCGGPMNNGHFTLSR